MPERTPSALSLALTYLRSAAAWSKGRLARALGHADESLLSHYERGAKPLTREKLESLVEPLGHPSEAVDVLLFAHQLIFPESPPDEAASPVALSPEEQQACDRAAMAAGWTAGQIAAGAIRGELIRRRRLEKIAADQQQAEVLFRGLSAVSGSDRKALISAFPDYWSWALAVRVCEESVRRAAHRPEEATELANLALAIAEKVPVAESWRSRLKGFAWAHVANARRVANDLAEADAAFARAWEFWRAGADSDPELLAEWHLFSLEASLRRDQIRFSEALELLDQARAACVRNQVVTGRLLLKKGNVFEQMGDSESALEALREAAPFVEASGDMRLTFGLRFDTANNFYLLSRYAEAAELMPKVRELAVQQANELDLTRVVWLESRVAAGEGRAEEAINGLDQVRRYFTAQGLAYDAALSSLDLAVLWLQDGRTEDVMTLAVAMGWIFKVKGIDREALATLKIFCDAARQGCATVELVQQAAAGIEKMRLSAPPTRKRKGRG